MTASDPSTQGTATTTASENRLRANVRNASHACGPKTELGRAIASRNALRHGLCSTQVLLPNEDPAEFQALHDAWFDHDRPTDPGHVAALDSLVLAAWRLRRCARQEAAVLTQRVLEAAAAYDRDADGQAAAVGQHLLGGPPDQDSQPPEDDPAPLLGQLQASAAGAAWLLDRWGALREQLIRYECWDAAALAAAIRLVGGRPEEPADPATAALFAAALAAHPAPRRFYDTWLRQVGRGAAAVFVDAVLPPEGPGDRAAGRAALQRGIEGEMSRLEDLKRTVLDPLAASERAAAADRAMFDDSPAGVLLRRYMTACEREYHKALAEVLKFRKERPPVAAVGPEPAPQVAAEPSPPAAAVAGPVRNEPIAEDSGDKEVVADGPVQVPAMPAAQPVDARSDVNETPPAPVSGPPWPVGAPG
jgi:hypothetical protein